MKRKIKWIVIRLKLRDRYFIPTYIDVAVHMDAAQKWIEWLAHRSRAEPNRLQIQLLNNLSTDRLPCVLTFFFFCFSQYYKTEFQMSYLESVNRRIHAPSYILSVLRCIYPCKVESKKVCCVLGSRKCKVENEPAFYASRKIMSKQRQEGETAVPVL